MALIFRYPSRTLVWRLKLEMKSIACSTKWVIVTVKMRGDSYLVIQEAELFIDYIRILKFYNLTCLHMERILQSISGWQPLP